MAKLITKFANPAGAITTNPNEFATSQVVGIDRNGRAYTVGGSGNWVPLDSTTRYYDPEYTKTNAQGKVIWDPSRASRYPISSIQSYDKGTILRSDSNGRYTVVRNVESP